MVNIIGIRFDTLVKRDGHVSEIVIAIIIVSCIVTYLQVTIAFRYFTLI